MVLAVNEAVTNALTHGVPPVRVSVWTAPDRMVVTVSDRGSGPGDPLAGMVPLPPTASGGRGLWIINQLWTDVVLDCAENGFRMRLVAGTELGEGNAMSELASGHQALLTASSDHRRVATQAWVRAARRRQEKVVTIALPLDDGSGEPGSGRSALGDPTAALPVTPIAPDQMYSAGGPADLVQRALAEGFRGLSIVVCGDCVIDSYSAEVHADIEAGLAELCGRHPVSALCVFDRGAGRLDAALTRHPDGLRAQLVDIRRTGDTLAVAGEIDESNSEVLSSALRHAAETSAPTMCLDLSRLRFLSAAGVSALAGGTAAYRAGGGRVELRDATPHIARVLWLLHVDSLPGFELVASGS